MMGSRCFEWFREPRSRSSGGSHHRYARRKRQRPKRVQYGLQYLTKPVELSHLTQVVRRQLAWRCSPQNEKR